jgi:hypothetical protein
MGYLKMLKIELHKDGSAPVEALGQINGTTVSGRKVEGGAERQDARPVHEAGSGRVKGH